MKILHVTPAYEPSWHMGGVVRSVSQLCRGLAGLGHEVTVFTTNSGGDRRMTVALNRPVELGGVEIYYFQTDFTPKFGFSRALRDSCRNLIKYYDIVHITSLWWYPGIAAGYAARKNNIPYVISTTGGLTKYSLMQKALKKKIYLRLLEKSNFRQAAAIRYTSEWERGQSAQMYPRPSFIVPNSSDSREFDHLQEKLLARSENNIPKDSRIILFLGRLHRVKGLDILIKSLAASLARIPNIYLILAGPDDGYGSFLRKLTKDLNISSQVIFTGHIPPEKRNSLLRTADIFTLVSHHENFGNAAVEAMLAGLPVLVSQNVGIYREILADGAGIVVPLDVRAIARGIEQMLGDPESLRAMGKSAAASARRRYDINVVARQMTTAYEDILSGRRSPGLSWSDALYQE